jgi:hypothetical protein
MPTLPQGLLNQWDLADRWRMSPRTLERWRWEGRGPHYLKLGNRIAYRIEDVEAYEAANTMAPQGGTRLSRRRRANRSAGKAA